MDTRNDKEIFASRNLKPGDNSANLLDINEDIENLMDHANQVYRISMNATLNRENPSVGLDSEKIIQQLRFYSSRLSQRAESLREKVNAWDLLMQEYQGSDHQKWLSPDRVSPDAFEKAIENLKGELESIHHHFISFRSQVDAGIDLVKAASLEVKKSGLNTTGLVNACNDISAVVDEIEQALVSVSQTIKVIEETKS